MYASKKGWKLEFIQISYSRKVWWVESLANLVNHLQFAKLKPSKVLVTINNYLADLFIRQTFFRQALEKSKFTKHSFHQTFPLYGLQNTKSNYFKSSLYITINTVDDTIIGVGVIGEHYPYQSIAIISKSIIIQFNIKLRN